MSLHIITRKPNNYFSQEYLKIIARKVLGKARGPQAVVASLTRGLDELGYKFKMNENVSASDFMYVNESLDALRWAINLKKDGLISRLIAGPNLVITPEDNEGIIKSPEIDIYLMPSQWTLDFYASYGNEIFNSKMRIWAAGVALPEVTLEDRKIILVYKKNISDDIFKSVIDELKKRKLAYEVLVYGAHKRSEYLRLLSKSRAIIYLQPVESQGIALLEAWAHNVPSLVFDNQKYCFENINKTVYGNVSAPYLSAATGLFFQTNNFSEKLGIFLESLPQYKPRSYVEDNFTDKIAAEKFLQIIK